jgi:hypothetical protein
MSYYKKIDVSGRLLELREFDDFDEYLKELNESSESGTMLVEITEDEYDKLYDYAEQHNRSTTQPIEGISFTWASGDDSPKDDSSILRLHTLNFFGMCGEVPTEGELDRIYNWLTKK